MEAVVLAGGKGADLSPLTSTVPKPLTKIFSRPLLSYILDSLLKANIKGCTLALNYMHDRIEAYYGNAYRGLPLSYSIESLPYGTAGGTRLAARSLNEAFIVVCANSYFEYDLSAAIEFHKKARCAVTIVCDKSDDPRKFGTVNTDSSGKILGFTEKPSWKQVSSRSINTGIYIIEPFVLEYIPKNCEFDLVRELFPLLLKEGVELRAFFAEGFWCGISTALDLLACLHSLLPEKLGVNLSANSFIRDEEQEDSSYTIIPPVYFGKNVSIGKGAVLGPDCVIEDNCVIGSGAKIDSSIIMPSVYLGADSYVSHSIICERSIIKNSVRIFDSDIIGGGCIIDEGAIIGSNVTIFPNKIIPANEIVSESIREGRLPVELLGEACVSGAAFSELSAERCAQLGQAFASARREASIAAACDGSRSAQAALSAIMSGIASVGKNICYYGTMHKAQAEFIFQAADMSSGIFVSYENNSLKIELCGKMALPIDRRTARDIETRCKRHDYDFTNGEFCGGVSDCSDFSDIYLKTLKEKFKPAVDKFAIICQNATISKTAACLGFDDNSKADLIFSISTDGKRLSTFIKGERQISHENLLALCCQHRFLSGRDLALPYESPVVIDRLASDNNQKTLRYSDEAIVENEHFASAFHSSTWVRDALFMIAELSIIENKTQKNLAALLKELPLFFIYRKTVADNELYGGMSQALERLAMTENSHSVGSGFEILTQNGKLMASPSGNGRLLHLMSEAASYEMAAELCSNILDRLLKR